MLEVTEQVDVLEVTGLRRGVLKIKGQLWCAGSLPIKVVLEITGQRRVQIRVQDSARKCWRSMG